MRDSEILKLAIQKVAGKDKKQYLYVWCHEEDPHYWEMVIMEGLAEHIIFNHNFAKAFFGNAKHYKWEYAPEFAGDNKVCVDWQFHLQQMVVEEDPYQYLKKFL